MFNNNNKKTLFWSSTFESESIPKTLEIQLIPETSNIMKGFILWTTHIL